MEPIHVLIVLIGTLILYVVAITITNPSMALYASLTLFLLAISILPLIVKNED